MSIAIQNVQCQKQNWYFLGGINELKVKNLNINLVLTQHKWHNIFILGMAYQLPFKMCNVKKRIGIFCELVFLWEVMM